MARFNASIEEILSMSGRKTTYKYTLISKDGVVKIEDAKNIKSFVLSYSSLTSLKSTLSLEMYDDNQYNFNSDMLKITMIIDVRGYHYEFPMGVYMMKSTPKNGDGSTTNVQVDSRSVNMYSKLLKYEEDTLENDMTIRAGTNAINKVKEMLDSTTVRIEDSGKVTPSDKIYKMGTSKLEVINTILNDAGYNSLSVDGEGYFYSSEYILPDNREIEIEYTDEINQQIFPEYNDDPNLADCYNVFTGSAIVNGQCINYRYVNSSNYSPISTVNLGRNKCCDPVEYGQLNSREELISKVMKQAMDNSMKYHKVSFKTFVSPLHGYLNCIHFKNAKVNMKGIETSWTIDSERNEMDHTIREAVYL